MNYIGALFIVFAALAIGISKAMESRRQVKELYAAISMLETVKNEISSRRTPIFEIFAGLSSSNNRYIKSFSEAVIENSDRLSELGFYEIWCGCVISELSALTQNALEEMSRVGRNLGRYDAELQKSALDRCISSLSAEYANTKDALKSNEKMYIGLGGGAGLILALVLI